MRVLNLVTSPDPFFTQQLEELAGRGVSQDTIEVPGTHSTRDDSVEPRSLRDYLRFYPTVLRKSLSSYDLIHAHYGLTAPFALSQPRRPVVLSLWGSDLYGAYSRLSRFAAQHFDAVIVMSQGMKEELGQDAYVIPHGVNMDLFKPLDQAMTQKMLQWDPEQAHVLFPYAPSRTEKDYPRAVEVVERAQRRLDRPVNIHTVYGKSHKEIPVYMNASDLLLLTSTHEGSPNTVKEALACNLPVVSTDVGDVKERLVGVRHSAVCANDEELVDSLVSILEAGERSNGRSQANHLRWDRIGDQLVDVYESVL